MRNLGHVRRTFGFIGASCLFFSASPAIRSLHAEGTEYPVKLAFLYNFAKFVEWPADAYGDPAAPLEICIVGRDPFSAAIERELRARKVGGRAVEVTTLRPTDKLSACHMAFIPATEKDQAAKIVSSLRGSRTLTVGETEGFAVLGGMINLTVEQNQVHFEVNRHAADRAGLKISSKLLSLAKIVTENVP